MLNKLILLSLLTFTCRDAVSVEKGPWMSPSDITDFREIKVPFQLPEPELKVFPNEAKDWVTTEITIVAPYPIEVSNIISSKMNPDFLSSGLNDPLCQDLIREVYASKQPEKVFITTSSKPIDEKSAILAPVTPLDGWIFYPSSMVGETIERKGKIMYSYAFTFKLPNAAGYRLNLFFNLHEDKKTQRFVPIGTLQYRKITVAPKNGSGELQFSVLYDEIDRYQKGDVPAKSLTPASLRALTPKKNLLSLGNHRRDVVPVSPHDLFNPPASASVATHPPTFVDLNTGKVIGADPEKNKVSSHASGNLKKKKK